MTTFAVGKVKIESCLTDVANIPVGGLNLSIKFLTIPFLETGVRHLLSRYIACDTTEYRQKYY